MVLILAGGLFGVLAGTVRAKAIAAMFCFGALSVIIAYAGFLVM